RRPMTEPQTATTLHSPKTFGPTTQVMPGSRRRVVAEANDLNPRRVRLFRCTGPSPRGLLRRVLRRSGIGPGEGEPSLAAPRRVASPTLWAISHDQHDRRVS